jgi:hypothetical protein
MWAPLERLNGGLWGRPKDWGNFNSYSTQEAHNNWQKLPIFKTSPKSGRFNVDTL